MLKLSFYVPKDHLESVKHALFDVDAGAYQHYQHVCWQVMGTGQFMPIEGSRPFVGDEGNLETIEEYRVEMLCDEAIIDKVIKALVTAHPYESPAYEAWPIPYCGIT